MPNTRSAKKRMKQDAKRREHNREVRSALRTQIKKLRSAVAGGDADGSQQEMTRAARSLDQAAAKGLIHKNKAARLKSRLSRLVNGLPTGADA